MKGRKRRLGRVRDWARKGGRGGAVKGGQGQGWEGKAREGRRSVLIRLRLPGPFTPIMRLTPPRLN